MGSKLINVQIPKQYKPYQGSAGPSKDHAALNTLLLFKELQKEGIPVTMDNGEHSKEFWDGNEKQIVLTKGGVTIHCSYDRWGFCVDGMDIDQLGFKETFESIVIWYNEK